MKYEYVTLDFPDDYDGKVVATLIKAKSLCPASRAVLYIHGYNDYFFQDHLAEAFTNRGYNFYAVDLRKCGRSLLEGQRPNFAMRISEYYPDIDSSLAHVIGDGNSDVTLLGHSAGGLLSALYAAEGCLAGSIDRIVLNSPFLSFNAKKYTLLSFVLPVASFISRFLPFIHSESGLSGVYFPSVYKKYKGEWDFDTRFKPPGGIPLYWSWLRTVREAQGKLKKGLGIKQPVLVMSSDRSFYGKHWSDEALCSDAVLNVADIEKYSSRIGGDVTYVQIEGGMHDLFLSRKDVREHALAVMFDWIENRK